MTKTEVQYEEEFWQILVYERHSGVIKPEDLNTPYLFHKCPDAMGTGWLQSIVNEEGICIFCGSSVPDNVMALMGILRS